MQEILAIAIVVLGFSILVSVFLLKGKITSVSHLSYLVFVISINFLNLLLIRYQVISPMLNFFGVYAFLYGILLWDYRLQLENKNSSGGKKRVIESIVIVFIAGYILVQASFGIKLKLFGYDDLETIPGLLFMTLSSFTGILEYYNKRKTFPLVTFLFGCSTLLSILVASEFFMDYTKVGEFYLGITSLIFLITYILLNTLIIHGLMLTKSNQFATSIKYSTSPLKRSELSAIGEKLETYLLNEKPFFKPDFALEELCTEVNIPKPKTSQALNDYFQKTFYELINELRIKEAISMMQKDPNQQLSIKEVMYGVGFSSKSTFNKYFKNATGYSPSDYRNLKS